MGKTKITEFASSLLNKKIYIFQMSANVLLEEMLGGIKIGYKNNRLTCEIDRNKELLKFIVEGGIYVLD